MHDWDHYVTSIPFTHQAEFDITRYTAAKAPELAPLALSEIALQAGSNALLGGAFAPGPQKLVLEGGPEFEAVKRRVLRSNPAGAIEVDLYEVWDAAGLLKFFSPAQLMAIYAASGVSSEKALVLVASGKRLREIERA